MFERSKAVGLVVECEDGLRFADPLRRDQYLARQAVAAADWTDASSFASSIGDIEHRTSGFDARQAVGRLIFQLLGLNGVDVLGYSRQLAAMPTDARHEFWLIYGPLCEALPVLEATPEALVATLLQVAEASSSDMTNGLIYGAIERWARERRDRAETLVQYLTDSSIPSLLPAAIAALAAFDRSSAHRTSLTLLSPGSDLAMAGAAIVAITSIPYQHSVDPLLVETVNTVDRLISETPSDLEPMLAQACFSLIELTNVAQQHIVALSTRTDSRTRHVVAIGLFRCGDMQSSHEWWRTALLNLTATPTADRATFRFLDYCASRLADADPRLALKFVERVALDREGDSATDCGELLDGTMAKIHKTAVRELEDAITEWFGCSSSALHRLAAGSVHRHGKHEGGPPLALSNRVLFGKPDEYVESVLSRVAGWVNGGKPLAALVASALRTSGLPQHLTSFIRELLVEIALRNYPQGAGDQLRDMLARGSVFPTEAAVLVASLAASDAYYAAIDALPEVLELRTPAQRVYLRHLDRLRENERIAEEVRKASAIMSLVHRVPLKYGRASFNFFDDRLTTPQPLHPFSYSVELPRGEVLDPIGQLMLRVNLRKGSLRSTAEVPA